MAETLQEFLVSLKYKQEGQQKFVGDLESAGRSVFNLGAKIATAMTGITLAVSKYAQGMEQLDFIALRTKTTVDNMRALQTAGASLGSSAEGMKSSLEGVSRFMRNTPGAVSFLASMGVQTKDANGKELDHTQIMKNIGASFRKMPQYMANQYAGILGIDENTELAMRDPNFDHNYDVFRKPLGNLDATAKSANTAVNHGRVAALTAEDLAARAAKPTLDAFNRLDTATGGLSTQIGAAAVGVTALGAAAATAAKLWNSIAPAAAKTVLPAAADGTGAAVAGGAGLLARSGSFVAGMLYSPDLNVGEDAQTDAAWARYRKSHGIADPLPMNEARGKIRRIDPSLEKVLDGIRWAESRGNPNAVSPAGAMGAYQLMPKTAKELGVDPFNESASRLAAGSMLARLRKHYGGNMQHALQAYNWGQGNMDSYLKTGYGVHHQVMPRETQNYPGQVAKGMTQNINVTINGASDPKATGREVHRQIQLAARNTAGMTR